MTFQHTLCASTTDVWRGGAGILILGILLHAVQIEGATNQTVDGSYFVGENPRLYLKDKPKHKGCAFAFILVQVFTPTSAKAA